jgi:hypothetical protein
MNPALRWHVGKIEYVVEVADAGSEFGGCPRGDGGDHCGGV